MARGSPDWWYGMIPAKVVFGIGQSSWYIAETGDIAGGSYADFCEYTVPSGFILNLGYIGASVSGPGIMKLAILIQTVAIATMYGDQTDFISLPDTSLYQVPGGYTVAIRLYNLDTVTWGFSAGLVGYEEVREP